MFAKILEKNTCENIFIFVFLRKLFSGEINFHKNTKTKIFRFNFVHTDVAVNETEILMRSDAKRCKKILNERNRNDAKIIRNGFCFALRSEITKN